MKLVDDLQTFSFETHCGDRLSALLIACEGARESQGMMLCSGPREVFARVEPALAAMTGTLKYLGERPDLAAANKLFGNAMILTICAGLSDVYRMARALDIEPADAHALFSTFKPGNTIDVRGAKMARGDFSPSFESVRCT